MLIEGEMLFFLGQMPHHTYEHSL